MGIEMTVEALQAFFKSVSAAELRSLDANGGLLAWCPDDGFAISVGDPKELVEDAEVWFCVLDAKLDRRAE